MNKELLTDILDVLEDDYSKDSKEYKFIKSFFISKTFDKYLDVFKFQFGNEPDESQRFIEGGYQTQSQIPFNQFVTQNKPRTSKFLQDMLVSRREIQKQERGILFDMLETTISSNELSKTQAILKKHSSSLDFNGQQLAHIFNKFIDKTKDLQKERDTLLQNLSRTNYQKKITNINHLKQIKKKDQKIKKLVKDFQELFKKIQNKNFDLKFDEFENMIQNENEKYLIHQAIQEDNLALIQYINDNHSHQINHMNKDNERPYIMALKLKKYSIFDLLISYPKLTRDQDDKIEIVLKENNVNLWGQNSLYEYSIKNKLLNLKEFFIEKIKKEDLKLCEHEDLFQACENDDLTEVSYLTEIKQKEVNITNNKQETPLFRACNKGSLEIVKYLIENGKADPNIKNYRMVSPLLLVSDKRHFNILKYLIEQAGVDPNQTNQQGDTALLISCHRGELQAVKFLLEQKNVDINQTNKNGDTALLKATYWNNLEVIKFLLEEKNVDIDQKNKNGFNCLLLASKWGYLEIVKYLIEEQNVNLESVTNNGDNVLIISADKGHIKIMKYLIEEAGMDINFQNKNGDTVLLRAAYRGEKNIVEYLLELRNVDVDQNNFDGDSALLLACKQGHLAIVKYLVENQGSDEAQENNFGDTALLKASASGHLDVIRYLLEERKVDVNKKNKNEDNALLLVCSEGKIDVIEYLILETEVDLNVKNLQEENVQSFAEKYGYTELLEKRDKKK